jgi:hypothetical protein
VATQLLFKPLDASASTGSEIARNRNGVVSSIDVETGLASLLAVAAGWDTPIALDSLCAASSARDADLGSHPMAHASGGKMKLSRTSDRDGANLTRLVWRWDPLCNGREVMG